MKNQIGHYGCIDSHFYKKPLYEKPGLKFRYFKYLLDAYLILTTLWKIFEFLVSVFWHAVIYETQPFFSTLLF